MLHFSALYRARSGRPAPRWSDDALSLLHRYRWPGNVRELANIVERLAILHPGREITPDDVAAVLRVDRAVAATPEAPPAASALDRPLNDALDEYERLLIKRALSVTGGNVAEAARRLNTDRPNLYRRMRRLGVEWSS